MCIQCVYSRDFTGQFLDGKLNIVTDMLQSFRSISQVSYGFWLDLLKVKDLKHQASNIGLPIDSIGKPVDGLLNRCSCWISQPSIVFISILNLFTINDETVEMLLSQVPTTELVHQESSVLLLYPSPRSIQMFHQQLLSHYKILYLLANIF